MNHWATSEFELSTFVTSVIVCVGRANWVRYSIGGLCQWPIASPNILGGEFGAEILMQIIAIDTLIAACKNEKRGTLREAFDGEKPDFIQEFDKECTGIMMRRDDDDDVGFSASFAIPVFLESGVGYVFDEEA